MSQTIDSRVVEMKFDNSNFESNVSQSMSTLDKLKNALKFDGASDGLESVSKAAKNVDVSSLGNAVDEVGVKFSSLQVIGTTALANLTNSAVNAGKSIVSSITSAIGEGGLTRALNLEQAQFMFEGLGMKVDEAMASCNDAVLGTAYSLDQAAMAAAQFGASGMEAGDDMTSALRAIAGVAAMTGSEYSDIANIFTTVAGNGRLMGDQLLQLSYRGMNAAATLAKYLGTTEEEVRSMVTAGEIDFETFYKAMDEAFGEHAKDANETFTGALANMKAAAARIGAEFYTPVLESSRKLFNAFTPVVDAIHTGLTPAIESLTGFIDNCFSKMIYWLGQLENGGMESFFDALYDRFSLSDAAGQNLNYTLTGLYSILKFVGQGVGAVINVFSELVSFIAPAVLAITGPIGELFTYINNFFQRWNIFGKIGDSIVSVLETLKNAFGEIWTALTGKFDIFSLIGKFFDGLDEFMSKSDLNFFQSIADGISEAINGIKDSIVDFINSDLCDFLISVIEAPFALLGALLESVGIDFTSFSSFVSSIMSVIENATTKVGEFIQSFINLPQVQSVITGFSKTIENTFGKLGDFFSGLVERFNEFVEGIQNMGSIGIGDIGTIVSNFVTDVLGYFKNLGNCFGDISGTVNKFIDGFKEGLSTATKTIEVFINKVIEIAKTIKENLNINLGSVLMIGIGAALIWLVKQVSGLYGSLSTIMGAVESVVRSISTGINRLTRALSTWLTGLAMESFSIGIKNLAESVLMLSVALIALAQVDVEDLERAGVALGSIAVGLVLFSAAMEAINKWSGEKIGNVLNGAFFVELAGSILILAVALKMLESLDPDSMLADIGILAGLLVGLTVAIGALNKTGGGFQASAGTIIAIAASILIIVKALNQLADLSLGDIIKSLISLGVVMGLLTAVIKSMTSSSISGSGFSLKSGVGVIGVAVAIELLVSAIKRIADMNPEDLIVGIAAIGSLLGEIGALFIMTGFAGQNAEKAGVEMLAVSASLILIAEAIKILGTMNESVIERGLTIVGGLMLLISAFMALSSVIEGGENAAKLGVEMLAISAALLILSGVIAIIGSLDGSQIFKGVVAIGFLMTFFALMIKATSMVNKESTQMKTTLTAMTVAIVALSVCIGVLAMIDPEGLGAATAAISIVMAVFALCIAATSKAKSAISSIILIGLALAEVTIAFGVLSSLDPTSVLASAAGLTAVMLSLSVALGVMGTMGTFANLAIGAVVILGVVIAEIAIVFWNLRELDPQSTLATAAGLSMVLLSFSAALVLMAAVGTLAIPAMIGCGLLLAFIQAFYQVIKEFSDETDTAKDVIENGLPVLEELATGIGRVIGDIVGGFLEASTEALVDVGDNLSGFMQHMSGFIEGAQSIDDSVVSGIDNLCEALAKLGAADFINAVEEFLAPGRDDNFASLGTRLQNIGKALTDFYGSMATINNMDRLVLATEAAKQMADMVNALPTTAEMNKSILSGDMSGFSDQMEKLGAGLSSFASKIGDANLNKINEAASCGQALNDLISNLPTKSWKETLLGDNSLDEFSGNIQIFAVAIHNMAECLGDTDLGNVKTACELGESLKDLANSLPSSGGFIDTILGSKEDLNTFSGNIQIFAVAIHNMAECLGGAELGPVKTACELGESLKDLVNALPDSGGALQTILGSPDFSTFSSGLKDYAKALVDMSGALAEGSVDKNAIDNAAACGESLAELCEKLPEAESLKSNILGGSPEDLGTFSTNLSAYAFALASLSEVEINETSFDGIIAATEALNDMEIPNFTDSKWEALFTEKEDISGLGDTLESLAVAFSVYSGILEGTNFNTELVTSATNAIVDIGSSLNNMETIDSGTVQQFVDSLNELGTIELGDFVESISEVGPKLTQAMTDISTAFSDPSLSTSISDSLSQTFSTGIDTAVANVGPKVSEAVSSIMSQFSSGLTDASSGESISSVFTSAISAAVSSITGYSSSFYSAGQSLGSQLISGAVSSISGGSSKISSAASGLVSAFSKGLSGSSGISSAFNSAIKGLISSIKGYNSSFKSAGQTLATNVASGITAGNSKCKSAMTTVVKNALTAVKSQNSAFRSAGKTLVTNLASGITSGKSSVNSAARSAVSGGASAARGYYSSWSSAGKYLVQGFANGIHNNAGLARNAAKYVASQATSSLNRNLVINSPSKITMKSGASFDEGFATGIIRNVSMVTSAVGEIATLSTVGLSEAVAKIADAIDSDIDINPTITPVLDLTNVESGAGRINTLLSDNGALGLAMNSANWISGSMNSREDPNAELISAIKKLGRDITSEPRSVTNNTVNGVSYDDGSAVQGAIETLVHAAKVGGRT